jgi:hypothetical protein
MSLLAVIAVLLALLFGAFLLVLLVPIQFAARGVFTEHVVDASASATWGFGVLSVHAAPDGTVVWFLRWPVYRYYRSETPQDSPEEAQDKPRRKRRRPSVRFLVRVARRLFTSLRLRARLLGRLGMGDPAETAKVFGLLATARVLIPGLDTRAVQVDWLDAALELEGHVNGRVWPASVAWILVSETAKSKFKTA